MACPVGWWLCVLVPTASCGEPHPTVGLFSYPPVPSARKEGFPTWATVHAHTPFLGVCPAGAWGRRGGESRTGTEWTAPPPP